MSWLTGTYDPRSVTPEELGAAMTGAADDPGGPAGASGREGAQS